MENASPTKDTTTTRRPAVKRSPYLCITKDGVKIIRPTGRVDNITLDEARRAVAAVRAMRNEAVGKA